MDEGTLNNIIVGPGLDRWPGTPSKPVENGAVEVAEQPNNTPDDQSAARRGDKRRGVLRLKVISAVQMACLCFSEEEIRQMVEQAFRNTRNRNTDY